jgi:hypothetical protein
VTESLFNSCPKVCREFPHLHDLLDFLPWGVSVVARIQWRTVEDVSPILFGVLAETSWSFSSIKPDVSWTGVPVSMTKFYDIHLSVIWQPSRTIFVSRMSVYYRHASVMWADSSCPLSLNYLVWKAMPLQCPSVGSWDVPREVRVPGLGWHRLACQLQC